jgi:predicted Zn finger-like uncharacterized protein
MIVHCTSCQAKFRIDDEKIAPRGAKARCSRCQTVFAVHRDLGAIPLPDSERPAPPSDAPSPAVERPSVTGGRAPLDVELERPERVALPAADPFEVPPEHAPERASPLFAAEPDPFAAAAGQSASEADPFGWTLPSPTARDSLGATVDPFEASADPFASPRESADPFPPAASSSAEPDPFERGVRGDPFGIAAADRSPRARRGAGVRGAPVVAGEPLSRGAPRAGC